MKLTQEPALAYPCLTGKQHHLIGHAGSGNNQVKAVLPLQSFLNDFQVHEAQ